MFTGSFLNNRYRLEAELGRGGAGTIYRATDALLERPVAVKVLTERKLGTQGRARLLHEAQAAARLNHPNIVSIYDAGQADEGLTFIVMELVEGKSLYEQPAQGLDQTLQTIKQICAALEHAHQHGIVHRDLKPENVLINQEGVAKLTDFGLARPVASRMTSEGEITGTVFYLAPEQALGQEVDVRTDLYSLGVMIYEMLTGQLPFVADDPIAVISQHLYAPVVPPRLRNAQVPPALDALVVQMMSKSPADRPASASEVRQRLGQITSLETPSLAPDEPALLERMARGRIVGRNKELGEARLLWERAVAEQGQLLLISGEPGIGKSRLAREIITLAEVSGGKALVGECYPEGNAPYAPFAQIFRKALSKASAFVDELPPYVLADLISITPDLQRLYPNIQPNPRLDPQAEQQRLFENSLAFFNSLSELAPVLIVLEDAHWADQASLALLRHLARRTHNLPIMIIATYREVELDETLPLQEVLQTLNRERLANRLKLTRLDRQAASKMLSILLGEQPPEDFVEGIYHETEGNPFFIEEVCKALLEDGRLYFADGRWIHPKLTDLQIPQSVKVTIQARLSKLGQPHQNCLRMAAILGRDFDYEILSIASDQDENLLIDALELAEHAQLIEETSSTKGGSFRFVHALIPLTLVEGLSGLRRRRMHRRAAEVIERLRPDDLEALAYQYSQSEETEKALEYLRKAGDRARIRFANEDAIRYYTNALEFCEPASRDHFDILAARVAVFDLVARRDKQLRDIQEMQTLAEAWNNDVSRFKALIALSDYYAATDYPLAREPSLAALSIAEVLSNLEFQGRALYRLGSAAWRDGDLLRCVEYLKSAQEKFQQASLPGEAIACLHQLSLTYVNLGDHESGLAAAEEAVQLSRQLKDRRQEAISLRRLGIALNAEARWSEALPLYQSALAMHREIGDRVEECNALNAIALVLIDLKRAEEARQYFLQGIELAELTGNTFGLSMLIGNYYDVYFHRQSDLEGGLAFLEQHYQKASQADERTLTYRILQYMTELLANLGLYDRALQAAEQALEKAEERDQIFIMGWMGRLHALQGNVSEGQLYLQNSLDRIKKMDDPQSFVDPLFNAAFVAWLGNQPGEWQKHLQTLEQVSAYWRKSKAEHPLAYSLDLEARLRINLGQAQAALNCSSELIGMVEKIAQSPSLEQFYYTHSCALRANGLDEQADVFLNQAYDFLMQVAGKISSEDLRQSYLANVRYNREIVADWESSRKTT